MRSSGPLLGYTERLHWKAVCCHREPGVVVSFKNGHDGAHFQTKAFIVLRMKNDIISHDVKDEKREKFKPWQTLRNHPTVLLWPEN